MDIVFGGGLAGFDCNPGYTTGYNKKEKSKNGTVYSTCIGGFVFCGNSQGRSFEKRKKKDKVNNYKKYNVCDESKNQ